MGAFLALHGSLLSGQGVSTPQERGATALAHALAGIGTTSRVLTIAAHPDDEDTPIIAWLARRQHVETAYLSLTRGDGGQNLIGNELGESLGAIRTQELLAARRLDGGRQYFTRAYDFGFSKNAEETFAHWPKDSILGDVVRVVRAFRPHVMVAFFTGTPLDGHGHHQVSAILAREAYEAAADTVRFPVQGFGMPWRPLKAYRSARQQPDSATLRVNTGAFDPVLGRSAYEIAADSRSQHKSQGFGMLQEKGVRWAYLTREATRSGPADARGEQSMFDGLDTTWAARRERLPFAAHEPLNAALALIDSARVLYRPNAPTVIVPHLARALEALYRARRLAGIASPMFIASGSGYAPMPPRRDGLADPDLYDALSLTIARTEQALIDAAGIAVEATAPRGTLPVREAEKVNVNDSLPVTITVYNRGARPLSVRRSMVLGIGSTLGARADRAIEVAPDSSHVSTHWAVGFEATSPWWRMRGRREQDWFLAPVDARDEVQQQTRSALRAAVQVEVAGQLLTIATPIVHRFADPVAGDRRVPVMAVPGITVNLSATTAYIRAGVPVERTITVRVHSAYPHSAPVAVRLEVPPGLQADSAERRRVLQADETAIVEFRLRGQLAEGWHAVRAYAVHEQVAANNGSYLIEYPHIDPLRLYGAAGMRLSAVTVTRPPRAKVGYLVGIADGGLEALRQLDIEVEPIEPASLGTLDLSRFTSIVVGPRAYEVHANLVTQNARLLEFTRRGGTLVVQYGAQNMNPLAGVLPFPLQWAPRASRVTLEDASVRVLQPRHPLLTVPNRISTTDWEGWVQERATYIPSVIDPRYTPLLSMNDAGEPEQRGALLTAPLGRGRYAYVTLALFRQLPAGVPGAARLLLNLIAGPPITP
ncbi:MAG: hypothetical protein RLZZ621_1715 [Gemmatimonadota bacterium]